MLLIPTTKTLSKRCINRAEALSVDKGSELLYFIFWTPTLNILKRTVKVSQLS